MTACVLDADVVIAVLDRTDRHHRAAADMLQAMAEEGVARLLSTVNYAESLVYPAGDDATFRTAVRAIDRLGVELVLPDKAIARDAARLRGPNVSLPDGFALATARARGAALASFDRGVRRSAKAAKLELAPGLE